MKRYLFLFLCVFFTIEAKTEEFQFGDFIPERLALDADRIYVISTFEGVNFFTAYTYSGDPAWEISFGSNIISCAYENEMLFVFSKARNGAAYYLTCIDAKMGKLIWEKPIWAPSQTTSGS